MFKVAGKALFVMYATYRQHSYWRRQHVSGMQQGRRNVAHLSELHVTGGCSWSHNYTAFESTELLGPLLDAVRPGSTVIDAGISCEKAAEHQQRSMQRHYTPACKAAHARKASLRHYHVHHVASVVQQGRRNSAQQSELQHARGPQVAVLQLLQLVASGTTILFLYSLSCWGRCWAP
jgi:hypothetical protein